MTRLSLYRVVLGGWAIALGLSSATQAADEAGHEFFENRIRPVLVQHCYRCHSEQVKKPKGGLRVDTRDAIRSGGDSGHAVVPGDLDESLILAALRYEDYEMPPSGPLDEAVVADFEAWVRMGAPDPRDKASVEQPPTIDIDKGREFWAFQPLQTGPVPQPQGNRWAWNDVDRFVAAGHQAKGLTPVADADRESWLRRVYFDLIGLPPSPEQLAAFQQDVSDEAFEKVVDELLASDRFGERWGRHWLDIVRYAESTGRTRNFPYPFAWRYRNYVIDAFNQDLPFDRFLLEQLAGDLLEAETDAQRDRLQIATGLLSMGAYDLNERNTQIYRMDVVGDQLDMVGRSVMGLTLGCARCHDHKFDPLPTSDYYAMAGILRSTEILNGYTNRRKNNEYVNPALFVRLATEPPAPPKAEFETLQVSQQQVNKSRQRVNQLRNRQRMLRKRRKQLNAAEQEELAALDDRIADADAEAKELRKQFNRSKRNKDQGKPVQGPFAMGVRDADKIADIAIHRGGDTKDLGDTVPRGFLQVIDSKAVNLPKDASGRRELAAWLTSGEHPLTARVYVNRIWQHLFGRGIVRTADNFGAMGEKPTHPELLDYLAHKFVADGWSTKRLIRFLVLSHTYRMSSDYQSANHDIDGENEWLWRVPLRRLEAEAIRDSVLQVSGQLKLEGPIASPIRDQPIRQLRNRRFEVKPGQWDYRSVYLPIVRSQLSNYLVTFDFPEPSEVKGTRDVTTVATQALFMMNSDLVAHHSRIAAEQITSMSDDNSRVIVQAYELTLNRKPTDDQLARALQFVKEATESAELGERRTKGSIKRNRLTAFTDLVHALMATSEFRYR